MVQKYLVLSEQLWNSPYADIICYPKVTKKELSVRLRELERLGVMAIEFTGEKTVLGTRVQGKGCVGIVVKAFTEAGGVAMKIRRTDADRREMKHEAEMLEMANAVSVGPRFLDLSRNFLLMEFIQGKLLPQWLEKVNQKQTVRGVLRKTLEQCWRLDLKGLDHGELSHAPKHIIVKNSKPYIIDFESASAARRASNVTAISQYFFIANGIAKKITNVIGDVDQAKLKLALRNYKREKTRKKFEAALRIMNLIGSGD